MLQEFHANATEAAVGIIRAHDELFSASEGGNLNGAQPASEGMLSPSDTGRHNQSMSRVEHFLAARQAKMEENIQRIASPGWLSVALETQ